MRETNMKEEYDVIVVGAGPTGSIAARTAAEECDVLLIEKRQEIGTPVRCAEGVDKDRLSKFIQPDKKWIANEIYGARIIAPDGTTLHLSGEAVGMEGEMGFILERKFFDRELAKNAARAGAHVMVRTRATGLIAENGAIKGVKLNRLGEYFEGTFQRWSSEQTAWSRRLDGGEGSAPRSSSRISRAASSTTWHA